jgi:hypothetical protein
MSASGSIRHRPRLAKSCASFAASALAITIVVLLLAPATASPVRTLTKFTRTAPYLGNESAAMSGVPHGCGNSISFTPPFFNVTSGKATEQEKSSSVPCAGQNSSTIFIEYAGLQTLSFTVTSGKYTIKANWVASFSVKLHVASGTSTLAPFASYYEWIVAQVFAANGTVYYPSHYSELTKTVTGSGSYSHSYKNVTQSAFVNATLTSGQTYYLMLWIATQVGTWATPGTSSTSASVSMSTATDYATLRSWSIS